MRFWQAIVCAEMTGGAVWADRYNDVLWLHMAADTANLLIGAVMWLAFKRIYGPE